MADYFTNISFTVTLPSEQNAKDAIQLYEKIADLIFEEDTDGFPDDLEVFAKFADPGISVELEGCDLWARDDWGCPNLEFVASYLQELVKRYMPGGGLGFEWSNDCSKHRIDAFGGGAAFATTDSIEWNTTWQWLKDQRTAHESKQKERTPS